MLVFISTVSVDAMAEVLLEKAVETAKSFLTPNS